MSLLDNLDIAVLAFIADHPDSSVTDCAKTLFKIELVATSKENKTKDK